MMKKTKKRLTRLLAICVCLIVVLSACASVDAPSGESTAVEESKATSGLEVSEVNTSLSESKTESLETTEDATLSEDVSIAPIEPTYPEERETTLEFVREYPLGGEGGIPFYLLYENDPEYAMIVTPEDICMDEKGNLYAFISGSVYDIQTSDVLDISERNVFSSSLYVYNGKIYSTTSDGKLNVYSMEKGLESSTRIAKATDTQSVNMYPTGNGASIVRIDSSFYDTSGNKASCGYSFKKSSGNMTVHGVKYKLDPYMWIMSELEGILTIKERRFASYPSRAWVDEFIFSQIGADGNPISEFAIYQLWTPKNIPCNIAEGDAVCKWYTGTDVSIGKSVFEDVLSARYFVGMDNQFYVLLIYPDGADLYRVNPGCSDITPIDLSAMEDPVTSFESWDNAITKSNSSSLGGAVRSTTVNSHIPYSSSRVRTRAQRMIDVAWVRLDGHDEPRTYIGNDGETYQTIPPHYVDDGEVGETLYGIPYCHGGLNGLETISSSWKYRSFSSIISGRDPDGNVYTAGNTRHKGLCDYSLGLDCSGFIGSAYGIQSKQSVTMLGSFGHEKTDVNDWSLMDAMLYIPENGDGNHCYLFVKIVNNDRVRVMDCTGREVNDDAPLSIANQIVLDNCTAIREISLDIARSCRVFDPFYDYTTTSTTHTYSCAQCNVNETENHVWEYVPFSATFHKRICVECDFFTYIQHSWSPGGSNIICGMCSYIYTGSGVPAGYVGDEPVQVDSFICVDVERRGTAVISREKSKC